MARKAPRRLSSRRTPCRPKPAPVVRRIVRCQACRRGFIASSGATLCLLCRSQSKAAVLRCVDAFFADAQDDKAVTVGDIVREVADVFGWAECPKATKRAIKERLTALVQGTARPIEEYD